MEFFRFIFSSFWIWLGFVTIIVCAGDVIVKIVAEIKKPGQPKYLTMKGTLADFEEFKEACEKNGGDIR